MPPKATHRATVPSTIIKQLTVPADPNMMIDLNALRRHASPPTTSDGATRQYYPPTAHVMLPHDTIRVEGHLTRPAQAAATVFINFFLFLFHCVLHIIPTWHVPAISPPSFHRQSIISEINFPIPLTYFHVSPFSLRNGPHFIYLSYPYFQFYLPSMWHRSQKLTPVIRPRPCHHFSKYPPSSSGTRILGQSNACQLYVQVSAFHVSAFSMIVSTLRIWLQQGDIQIGMGGGYVQIG